MSCWQRFHRSDALVPERQSLHRSIPAYCNTCERLPTGTLVDGEIVALDQDGRISFPFANLPEKRRTQWALTKEEMKKCVWLRPEVVAQIEFNEWTPDGHLRHSTFVGLREDKDPKEVVREL